MSILRLIGSSYVISCYAAGIVGGLVAVLAILAGSPLLVQVCLFTAATSLLKAVIVRTADRLGLLGAIQHRITRFWRVDRHSLL